jgi:hypothetical protein
MFVLLAVVPYAVTVVFYALDSNDLFRRAAGQIPPNAALRLIVPVIIGGLTPLALASKNTGLSGSDRLILSSATAFSAMYVVVVLIALRSATVFLSLYHPFRLRRPTVCLHPLRLGWPSVQLPRGRHVLVSLGLAVIAYGAGVNIAVSLD